MKTLHLSIIIGINFLFFVFLMMHVNSYAYTCAVNAPSVTTQYHYLHSDSVFVGTVSSITNNTDHQLNVKFDVEKSWKGSQHPTITTYGLVACGYSLVRGEKYLVFANGSPLDYDPWATKPFDNALDDIVLLDSPQFQEKANVDEILYKKLVNAKDTLFNMMGSKISKIPISYVWANDLNFTLDVGIADKKALLQSGAQEYKQKLEEIVGNVPIRVQYGEYATALPEIITQHPIQLQSPLKQFKSGIKSHDVKCILGFELILKTENNSPACVELETAQKFVDRGWAKMIISNVLNSGTIVTIPVNSSISTSGLTFSPSTVQVVIGVNSTVEWINMDSVMNDITSDSRSFETSLIPHGHAWEHIFDKIGTYQYHSAIHPWLKGTVIVVENNASSQQISNSDQQAKLLSENDCGQFYTVPENHTSLNTVPVLLMKTNSTACAKLTFTIISNYNDCNGPNCQHVLDVEPTGLIGNLHYEKHGDSFSITPGKDYTNSFKIVTIPSTVDLANYPIGTNYTVTYIIRPLSNATGFYDQSIPRLACERYPLAVGYAADQVNASDFSYIDTLNPSCVSGAYGLTKVEVSGMDYKEVTLRLAVLEQVK